MQRKRQSGQGMLEYIILTSLIAIVCLGVTRDFGSSLKTKYDNLRAKMNKELQAVLKK